MVKERTVIWAGRLGWAAIPLTAGGPIGASLHDWEAGTRTSATAALWLAWLVTMLATMVPHPLALTTWRVLAPAAAAAVALAAIDSHPSPFGALNVAVVLVTAFAPATASACVNGPAYPNERRFPLRPPAVAVVGAAPAAWLALVGAPAAALMLLADRRWIAGAAVAVLAAAATAVAGRALHGLARRWLVVVPAGVVVHDPLTLADPVLFHRRTIARLGPAPAEPAEPRLDLTAGALGLALELRLAEATGVLVVTRPGRRPEAETVSTTSLLVAPTRAAALLAEVASRGYPVG